MTVYETLYALSETGHLQLPVVIVLLHMQLVEVEIKGRVQQHWA